MSDAPPNAVAELTPTGRLRAAINLGNSVLAQGTPDAPRGITVDLARELATRLSAPLDLVPFPAAGKVFDALKDGRWDIAFLAWGAAMLAGGWLLKLSGEHETPEGEPLARN